MNLALINKFSVDPRFFQLFNNIVLMVCGYFFLNFRRDFTYLLPVFILGIFLDWSLSRFLSSQRKLRSVPDRMISILNTIVSIITIIKFDSNHFYVLVILVSILSKYLVVDENKNHIFNPANFGIIFALLFVNTIPLRIIYNQFAGLSIYLYYFLILNGFLITIFARRIILAFSFLISSIVLFAALSPFWGFPSTFLLGPTFSFSGMLFTFFMITDPKTTPDTFLGQILFGFLIGSISFVLRVNQYVHDMFFALFVTTALYKFYLHFFNYKVLTFKKS